MSSFAVYATTYGVRLAALAVGLLTNIVIARSLGPAGRGDVSAFIAAVSVLVQLTGFGLSSSSVVELGGDPKRARQVGTLLFLASLLVVPVALAGAFLFDHFSAVRIEGPTVILAILWPLTQLLGLNLQAAFLGVGNYRWFNGLELTTRLLCLAAVSAVVAWRTPSTPLILLALFGAETVVVLAGVVHFAGRWGAGLPEQPLVRRMAMMGFRASLSLIPAYLIVRGDVVLVRMWRGAAETGLYAIAGQVVTLIWMIPAAAAQVLFSSIARSTSRAADVARVSAAMVWILGLVCAGALVMGAPAIRLVFGQSYSGAFPMLAVLLPGALALGVETTLVQYFNAGGYPLRIVRYWALALGLNVSLNVLLIPRWGALGAAASSTAGYVLIAALVALRFRHETGIGFRELLRFPRLAAASTVTAVQAKSVTGAVQ
ncbi:MAG: polysaccharide biosynthesis C-terminal domain-containing protein [Gemmatimonadota bacterium]